MWILITTILLVAAAAALAALRVVRSRFRFHWLLAVGAALLAWVSIFVWWAQQPLQVTLPVWLPSDLFPSAPSFAVSDLIWPYAIGLMTMILAALLIAPGRALQGGPGSWSIILALGALGLLGATAANALSLVLVWATLDLVELAITLRSAGDIRSQQRALTAFSARLGGVGLVVLAEVLGGTPGGTGDFGSIVSPGGVLLAAAVLVRLAAYTTPQPEGRTPISGAGVDVVLQLTTATVGVAALSHLPPESFDTPSSAVLAVACALAAVYGAWMWLRAPAKTAGQPFFILTLSGLAVYSALRGNPAGTTAWGAGMVLAGGALLLTASPRGWMRSAILVGIWSLSSLPFSLTAAAWQGAGGIMDWLIPAFVLAQGMMLAGFFHQTYGPRSLEEAESPPAWTRLLVPAGLLLLLLTQVLLGIWGWTGALQVGAWLAAVLVAIIFAILAWIRQRVPLLNPIPAEWQPTPSAGGTRGVRRLATMAFADAQRMSDGLWAMLEGEAGIMWSVLLLVVLVLLIAGGKP